MAINNGSLEAVNCYIHSVRYIWPSTEELAASKMASSGHLRRCNADTTEEIYLTYSNKPY
eukprot:scaffold1073_cov113-Skeletonema_dohrnii-CCMP3373.AAC.5